MRLAAEPVTEVHHLTVKSQQFSLCFLSEWILGGEDPLSLQHSSDVSHSGDTKSWATRSLSWTRTATHWTVMDSARRGNAWGIWRTSLITCRVRVSKTWPRHKHLLSHPGCTWTALAALTSSITQILTLMSPFLVLLINTTKPLKLSSTRTRLQTAWPQRLAPRTAPLFVTCLILSCPSKWTWGYHFSRMFCRPSGNRIQEIMPFEGIYDLMYQIYLLLVPVSLVLTGRRILQHPCCAWSVLLLLPYPSQAVLVLIKKSFRAELTGSMPRWEPCLLEPCVQISTLHTGKFSPLTMHLLLTEDWYCLTEDLFWGCGCDTAEFGQKGV